jgi:peptidoglycan-N-acetylglucosamine deacetylase
MRSLRASCVSVIAAVGATVGIAAMATTAARAWSQECPGNADALGTSRVLTLKPGQLPRVGIMQYPQN